MGRGPATARGLAVALATLLAAACRSEPPKSTAVPDAGAAPAASVSAAPAAESRANDPRWQRAMGDDPLDIQRLAAAVSAADLLEAVSEGGDVARVALLALPHADDAEVAFGALCDRAAASPADPPRAALLEAILGIAGRPQPQREPLDPDGVKRCAEVLPRLAGDAALPTVERNTALSAARAMALGGRMDGRQVPPKL